VGRSEGAEFGVVVVVPAEQRTDKARRANDVLTEMHCIGD